MTPDKSELRRTMRQQRRLLDTAFRKSASIAIIQHILQLPNWSHSARIALYMAQDGEMDTALLATACREAGKQLFLPVIDDGKAMVFAAWDTEARLELNRFGIEQPDKHAARCAAEFLDVVALPLVAWDASGGRLGMGGGFYDRAFADINGPTMMGLAYEVQRVSHIELDEWDIPLDFVLTESALHDCRG